MARGIGANRGQFALLVLTNAFVGAMVGTERSVLPLIAREEFGIASKAAALAFLAGFGFSKAIGNLMAGRLSDRFGRKRILLVGWGIGLPVPLLVGFADSWAWIVGANLLLGGNQALCWTSTVLMKIDLAGRRQRGMATALNEWAGYIGVGSAAWITGALAGTFGTRMVPFTVGLACVLLGALISGSLLHETVPTDGREASERDSPMRTVARTGWNERHLRTLSHAGMATNLKDGLIWVLVPISLENAGLTLAQVGVVAAIYPAVWGFGQLAAGPLSDRWGRRPMILGGLLTQAAGVASFAIGAAYWHWVTAAVVAGLGTAMAYPTLLAAVADRVDPATRGSVLGGYRFWRDGGYALSGLLVGPIADAFGDDAALYLVAGLLVASAIPVASQHSDRGR